MCGIAGVVRKDGGPVERVVLERLAAALAHRGPDGVGYYLAGSVGFVQTRLAIIDLATGDQPFVDAAGRALVANGEIYNYRELGQALPPGALATASDCELPLALYARDGVAGFDRLRGMYALALHDPGARRVVLLRDPFGIKPLYVAETATALYFASEPQALIACGAVAARPDRATIDEVLQLHYATGRTTPFAGITRLLPGERLTIRDGVIVDRSIRPALPDRRAPARSDPTMIDRLDAVLGDSVRVHCRADVAFGLFLSGGIDSALILSYMAAVTDAPVRCFTANFTTHFNGDSVADEAQAAARVAQHFGAEHNVVTVTEADFWRTLPGIAAALDDFTPDYATIPLYLLAERAGGDLKVVLTGEGGDELFAGYGRYRRTFKLFPSRRGTLHRIGIAPPGWRCGLDRLEALAQRADLTALQRAQAVDCAGWLPNDLLTKLDRCLMAHGLEGRTPLLDPLVADLSFPLPDRQKIAGRFGKFILRQLVERRVKPLDPFARKQGFTVPVGAWIAGHGARLAPLVLAQPGIAALGQQDRIRRAFTVVDKRNLQAAWVLLFYALWHRRHIRGLPPVGDVFETLAAG